MTFEWHTEEESKWDAPQTPPQPQPQRAHPSVRLLFFTFLLTGGVLLLLYRAARMRVETVEAEVQAQVLAAHELVQEAAARRDVELFLSLTWVGSRNRSLEQMVRREAGFFDRSAYSLPLAEHGSSPREAQVWLSPDLASATVTTTLPYTTHTAEGQAETVQLRHAMFYRQQDGQWQLTQPARDYWGEWIVDKHDGLTARYPSRDAAVAARLVGDIHQRLDDVCLALGGCPEAFHIWLRLERDLYLLAQNEPLLISAPGGVSISVATPSLLGVPAGEAAYQALLRGYLRLLVGQLMEQLTHSRWPDQDLYLQSLRQQIDVDLGLQPWPPPNITTESKLLPVAQDVALLCTDGAAEGGALIRLEHETGEWQSEPGERYVGLVPLGNGEALLLQEHHRGSPDADSLIKVWHQGSAVATLPSLNLLHRSPGGNTFQAMDREQNYVVARLDNLDNCYSGSCDLTMIRSSIVAWSPDGSHTLIRREVQGSGSLPAGVEALFLGDAQGNVLRMVGQGHSPFWLDAETYGYVSTDPVSDFTQEYQLVLASVEDPSPRLIVGGKRFEALLPAGQSRAGEPRYSRLYISRVGAHPAHPDTLFVAASLSQRGRSSRLSFDLFFYTVDVRSGEVALRLSLQQAQSFDFPVFSPDGRWLTFSGYDPQAMNGALYLYDVESERVSDVSFAVNRPYALPTYHWSADSSHLLMLERGLIRLIEPSSGEENVLAPPVPGCAFGAWLN